MGGRRYARSLAILTVGATALSVASCGGGSGQAASMRDGGAAGHDGGGAGHDGGGAGRDGGGSDAAACPTAGSLAAEPSPVQVALDGGVPLDQFLYALAVARCQYFSRCFALSTYVANDCVDQLVNNNSSFYYPPGGTTITYLDPSSALAQAAAAGRVRYNPQREAQCFAAQLAAGCAGSDLYVNLPACASVFTCPAGTDGGVGATDGGGADGGATCTQLVSFYDHPAQTCSTDQDCGGGADASQSSYCVAGICVPWRCGYFPIMGIEGCTSLAAAGEPCSRTPSAFSTIRRGRTRFARRG